MSKKKMSKKKKLHIALAALAAVVVIGAAAFTLFIQPKLETEEVVYKENTAQYGPLQSGVTESGVVSLGVSTQVYDLDISTDEEDDDDDDEEDEEEDYLKVEEVYVAVGQRITEGDPVYKFTDDSVSDVRKALTYAKTEAQIAYAQAQTEYDIGVLQAGLSYDETMLASNLAQQEYDNTIATLTSEMSAKSLEIEKLLVEIYEAQLALVEDDYREQKASVIEAYEQAIEDMEDVSDEFVTNRVEAVNTLRSAKQSYDQFFEQFDEANEQIEDKIEQVHELEQEILYNQQLLEKDILEASHTLESASVSGSIADTKYSSSLTSYETSLTKASNELEEATEKLEAFENFVGDGTIYAEGTGLVTEVGFAVDDYLMTTGTLLSYATSEAMTVSVDVSQEDVVTMKVGDSVNIVFTAYGDEICTGVIQSITTTATSRSSATISYPVVVSIQGDTSKLYGGMTADVTFVTEETADVVYVSRKAIVTQNGKSYVYKKQGKEYVLSPVTTGFTDGANVEIVSGLEEGETYYIESVVTKETAKETTKDDRATQSAAENGNVKEMEDVPNMENMPEMGDMPAMGEMPGMEEQK